MSLSRTTLPGRIPAVKFNPDGTVRPFAGNTVICHLDQQGPNAGAFDALLDIYREAQGRAFVRKMTLLPPSSYHMTVFDGVNDKDRDQVWPAGLTPDLSIEECSRILEERLRTSGPYPVAPIRLRVDIREVPADAKPVLRFELLPCDADEARKLQGLRDRLAQVFGFRRASHDGYVFRISMTYLIRALEGEESNDFSQCFRRWCEDLERRCPLITLGMPEFCTFKDMYAFKRELYLPE
jgi:hypothetical protein